MDLWHIMYIPKQRQNTTSITAKNPTKFCSMIKTSKYSLWGKVC